jgi:hypothetical protein
MNAHRLRVMLAWFIGSWSAFALLAAAGGARAAPLPADEAQRACWLKQTAERTRANLKEPTQVDFSNLRHGYKVRSPFLVEFAVRGMGVVPAGKALAGTGHHHILVDARLPLNVSEKIPFSDTHRHFGKGQTQAVLDLPPGKHTLRLLFADHEHRPYFVYSPEITIEVTGARTSEAPKIDARNFDATCAAWYQDEVARPRRSGDWVEIVNLRDGETVASPFNVRFSVDGYGVCAAGQSAERTGHFVIEAVREGRVLRSVDLANGATQYNLDLPNGDYVLRLRFVDARQRELLPASETPVSVNGQGRL